MCSRTKRAALLGLELPSQKSLPKEETILSGIDVLVARFYDCQNNLSWINSQESKHMLCTLTLSFRTLLGSSILRNFGRLVLGYIEADVCRIYARFAASKFQMSTSCTLNTAKLRQKMLAISLNICKFTQVSLSLSLSLRTNENISEFHEIEDADEVILRTLHSHCTPNVFSYT